MSNQPGSRTANMVHFPNKDASDPRALDEFLDDPFAGGTLTVGADDATPATVSLYGGGTGEAGGKLRIYNNSDDDGTVGFWEIAAEDGTGNLVITADGSTDTIIVGTDNVVTIPAGELSIGQSDTTGGFLRVYGPGTGSNEGGEIQIYTAADHDGTYEFYRIDVFQDDLRIGRAGNTDITLKSDGTIQLHQYGAGVLNTDSSGNVTVGAAGGEWTAHSSNDLATTSGTTATFSSIPSGVEEIKLVLNSVSYTTTTLPGVRLGDATTGGVLTTGYVASAFDQTAEFATTTYMPLRRNSVANTFVFRGIVMLHKTTGNKWMSQSSCVSTSSGLCHGWGQVTLAGELDRVQLMNGTFDAGSISLWYR